MMSHILIENIFMSPFPSFEIPKMSGFRTNTDSSSIINGEYLLESSLHSTPISLRLDFRYKEKKKHSIDSVGNNVGNDENNKTIDFTKKFMFSLHENFSRNYRHLDTKQRKFHLGLFLVQNVLGSTLSTSCVRFDFQRTYISQYSFNALKNFARQLFSHAPTFKLRHLKDLNLTQLIHFLRTNEFNQSISLLQANDNKKKSDSNNSNSDSDSSIILSLYYSIIERVIQTDGECIVIRLSTLIDRNEQKKLYQISIFCNGRRDGTYVLFPILNDINNIQQIQRTTIAWKQSKEMIYSIEDDYVRLNCINNNDQEERNILFVSLIDVECVLILSSNLSNHVRTVRNKTRTVFNYCDRTTHNASFNAKFQVLSNHLDTDSNKNKDDERIVIVTCVLIRLSINCNIHNCDVHAVRNSNNCDHDYCVLIREERGNENSNNNDVISSIDGEYFLIIIPSELLKRTNSIDTNNNDDDDDNNYTGTPTNIDNDFNNRCSSILVWKRIDHNKNNVTDVSTRLFQEWVCILFLKLSKVRQEEDKERKVLSVSLIDGECVLILLSKLSTRTDASNTVKGSNGANIIDSVLLFLLSNRTECQDRKKISSKPYKNDIDYNTNNNNKVIFDSSVLIQEERDDKNNSISYNDNNDRNDHAICNNYKCDRIVHSMKTSIVNETKRSPKTGESSMIGNNDNNNNERSIDYLLIMLSELSKCNDDDYIDVRLSIIPVLSSNRNYKKDSNDNEENRNHEECIFICVESVLLPLSKLLSKHKDDNNNNTSVALNMLLKLLKCHNNANNEKRIDYILILLKELSNTTSASILLLESLTGKNNSNDIEKCIVLSKCDDNTDINNCNVSNTENGNSNSNDSDSNNNNDKCIDCNDDGMNSIKNSIRKGINNTTIELSDDNSNDTTQIRLFIASVCTPLFRLMIAMRSSTVLTTCILGYKYDIILKALFVFNCSILYWIFTIDGEYQNPQRIRILVNDISLYESSWNRALRLESYLSSTKQQQAAKRGEMS